MQRNAELPPPAYNAAPGHSPSSNEMLSPHPAHASHVSPETTGQTQQQQNGYVAAQPGSAYVAPPLQEPMGASPPPQNPASAYIPQNQAFTPSPLSSPEAGYVQTTQEQHIHPSQDGQNISSQPQVHQAPETHYFDGEMRKSEPQPQPDLEAHPAMNAKYLSEGQQQPQMQGGQQHENMAYPGTTGNGGYQTAIALKDLGRVPAPVDCPRCNRRGLTEVESESGGFTK